MYNVTKKKQPLKMIKGQQYFLTHTLKSYVEMDSAASHDKTQQHNYWGK